MKDFHIILVFLFQLRTFGYGQHCEFLRETITCQEIQQEEFLNKILILAAINPGKTVSTIEISNSNFSRIDYFPNPVKFVSRFKVKNLIIENSNITHIKDDAFKELTGLKRLILRDNQIEDTSFVKVFDYYIDEFYLDLNRNSIKVLDLNNFAWNRYDNSYTSIQLKENNIDVIKPANRLRVYDSIDLSFNNLEQFNETYLNAFTVSLDLSHNKIKNLSLLYKTSSSYDYDYGYLPQYWKHSVNIIGNNVSFFGEYEKFYCDELYSTSLIKNIMRIGTFLSFKNSNIGILNRTAWDISKVSGKYGLDLSNASISSISSYYFVGTIPMLNLSYNNISSIDHGIFRQATIHSLDLSCSQIKNLSGESFKRLDCHHLNLTGNHLKTTEDICRYTQFRTINLSGNKFQALGKDLFVNCTSLKTLDLSYNNIVHLKSFAFSNSTTIKNIDLSHNNLTTLESNAIFNLTVTSLNLSNSNIYYIAKKAFNHLHELELLDLSASGITTIEADAFFDLPMIRSIDLSHNNLVVIHSHTFRNFQGLSLNMSWNRIGRLNTSAFENMKLISLDLSSNILNEIPIDSFKYSNIDKMLLLDNNLSAPISFDHTVNVSSLLLSFNGMLKKQYISSAYLEELHFVDSSFESLQDGCFAGLPYLKELHFDKSRIASYESKALQGLNFLNHLDSSTLLRDRQILENDIFSDLSSLRTLLIDAPTLRSLERGSLSGLDSLEILNITGTMVETLPPGIFDDLRNLLILDLSGNSIWNLASNTLFGNLKRLTGLYLQHNLLSSIPLELFNNLKNLEILRIDDNVLSELVPGVFDDLHALRVLNLSQNTMLFQHNGDLNSAVALKTLRNIQILNIDNTNVNAAFVKKLPLSFGNLFSIGINNNGFLCVDLINILEYFNRRSIHYTPENPTYNTPNLDGIACKFTYH